MAGTIARLGWTNPQTGVFGAHPALGPLLDLNDGVTFTLATPAGIELPSPPRTLVTTGNVRAQGERAVKAIYRHNREATLRVLVGPMASYSDLAATVRTLLSWVTAPPAMPITLQYQPPNAPAPVYLDVVGCAADIPTDEGDWLRLQFEPIELAFVARPGLRGDRVTLSNLAVNPGFEAPGGPGTLVFSDTFATNDAYTLVSGVMPAVSANTLVIPAGTTVAFGSPAWGAVQSWQVRWQYLSNLVAEFHLHKQDANNYLYAFAQSGSITLAEVVAGTFHQLATASYAALTPGAWYWIGFTQFPSAPGSAPYVRATLYTDSGGVIGSQVATIAAATYDATTALVGKMELTATNAVLTVGGAYSNVNAVWLFGPGGWMLGNASTGTVAGVWEGGGNGSPTTYPGGPVTSFAAARMDLPPGGTVNAYWTPYNGAAQPWANGAIPVRAAGDTLAAVAHVTSSGLSAGAVLSLAVYEYDGTGTLLRTTTIATASGNRAAWTALSGSVVTGAGTGYVSLFLACADLSANGASANGIVWWDNVQCWNVTTTGQAAGAMPYCELRFPQSPAQLVISGLLGDLPAPAQLAFGTYLSNWPAGGTLQFALGRRGTASANARLAGVSHGWYATSAAPTATAVLDASSYGGYYAQATISSGWNPRAFSFAPADAPGTYHLLARFLTQQALANLSNVEVRATMQQRLQAWYGALDSSDQLNISYAPFTFPMTVSNAWAVVDAGQVAAPAFNAGALADPAQTYLTPHTQWADLTSGGSLCSINWQMLLPVDGSLLTGVLNNPSNAPFAVASAWLWTYFDGLGTNLGIPAAWAYSLESTALPNPAHASGGPGTTSSGAINVNSGADPYLTLDPQLQLGGNGGINQLAAYVSDGSGAVLPFCADIEYTPLYLYPR